MLGKYQTHPEDYVQDEMSQNLLKAFRVYPS